MAVTPPKWDKEPHVSKPVIAAVDVPEAPSFDDLEIVTVYVCDECEAISEEYADKLYECSSCGTIFLKEDSDYDSHRCSCGIFAAKLADKGCVECREAEVRESNGVQCPNCGDLIELETADGWAEHVKECYA